MRLLKHSGVATRYITGLLIIILAAYPVIFPESAPPVPSVEASAGDEKIYYFLNDHLGSVDAVLDEQGNVVERRDYLPYGQERFVHEELNAPDTEQGFTGKELDSETGLNYYGARYYDPITGRFITMDPLLLNLDKMSQAQRNAFLSNPQNLNMYSYAQNNPVRYVDSTGMYKEDFHYFLTLYLGLAAGFDDSTANEIAWYDDRVDTNPTTTPVNASHVINGTTSKYHFLDEETALRNLMDATASGDTKEFGGALHTYQDVSGAHKGLSQIGHAWLTKKEEYFGTRTDPDKTVNDVDKAYSVARKSFIYIRTFRMQKLGLENGDEITNYNKETDDLWNAISGDVKDYLSAGDKSDTVIRKAIDEKSNED
ncbi:hypothetical protein KJ807_03335 [Patescibacteria group bacterium]|nr:hypothetical protein [Patescibacteria group bacterium]MBU1939065.1 hypothetical protein [Patescibacteria group bacterium]